MYWNIKLEILSKNVHSAGSYLFKSAMETPEQYL